MTNQPVDDNAPPTASLWDREMERLLGQFHPGRRPADFAAWSEEARRQHGHRPYWVLRRAVTKLLQDNAVTKLPTALFFGEFIGEAQRDYDWKVQEERPALALDEERQERDRRRTYDAIRKIEGPFTEKFEWALCRGMALQRRRDELMDKYRREHGIEKGRTVPEIAWRGKDDIYDADIQACYDERRAANVPIGLPGSPTSKHKGNFINTGFGPLQDLSYRRGYDKDPEKFHREVGFKTARQMYEERKAAGTLTPRTEEYLLEKIAEEEGRGA